MISIGGDMADGLQMRRRSITARPAISADTQSDARIKGPREAHAEATMASAAADAFRHDAVGVVAIGC